MRWTTLIAMAWLAAPLSSGFAPAAPPAEQTASQTAGARPGGGDGEKDAKTDDARGDGKERERLVMAFVERHQPDLAKVLASLKRRKAAEYDAAIEDLHGTVLRLEAVRSRDERLHEIELRSWRARTRVELLAAQRIAGRVKDRAGLEARLRDAVSEELDARAEHLAYRRQRSMAWYDRQLDRLRDKRDELVASRLKSLLDEDGDEPQGPPAGSR